MTAAVRDAYLEARKAGDAAWAVWGGTPPPPPGTPGAAERDAAYAEVTRLGRVFVGLLRTERVPTGRPS